MELADSHNAAGSGLITDFIRRYPTRVLETLLKDRTTGRNIIWADDEYESLGDGYMGDDEITVDKITAPSSDVIKLRISKEQEHQSMRTKTRAEVFTPSWLCNQMNNYIDAEWFGERGVFNTEGDQAWKRNESVVTFPQKKGHGWHAYVSSPRLEITCGEAPFICSRYDTVTGSFLPVKDRIGFLDRKLRVVGERTQTRNQWVKWALEALKSTYGFEYQGDNLLIARINVFESFCEHLRERWGVGPSDEEVDQVSWIVSWNLWQMNGLTGAVPTNKMDAVVQSFFCDYEEPEPQPAQMSLFDLLENEDDGSNESDQKQVEEPDDSVPLCVIYDWQEDKPFEFVSMKGKVSSMGKKFYAVIGNPPYQEEFNDKGNKTYAKPVYNSFMDAAEQVSDRVELVTPARFLFNAGSTPKAWNEKKLSDPHFKVLQYEADASKAFPNTDIKGGIAVTLRDGTRNFGPVGTFIPYKELESIYKKVVSFKDFDGLDGIVHTAYAYHFTDRLHDENPDAKERMSKGHAYDLKSNVLEKLTDIFHETKPNDGHEYIRILGLVNAARVYRYIRRDYVNEPGDLLKWKVIVPAANGSGALGEVVSTPLIGQPLIGHTETFMSLGAFDSEEEAQALLRYVKSKFARVLLGILKTTQHNPPEKWRFIPLQNFSSTSDIDWSKSISEVDQQLYAKYGLDEKEIDFIESHVKEMD